MSSFHFDNASDAVEVGQEVEAKLLALTTKRKSCSFQACNRQRKRMGRLEQRFESQETFEVVVADVVKGGLVADVGVRGFIPASMVERHFVEDFSDYKGRTLRVKVKELDRENNKVIFPQKMFWMQNSKLINYKSWLSLKKVK